MHAPEHGSHQQQFRLFAYYNRWFNERLYGLAADLSDTVRRLDRGAFFGSIQGTLSHILWGDRIWLARFSTTPGGFQSLDDAELLHSFGSTRTALNEDFDALRAGRAQTDAVIMRWVEELTPGVLNAPMRYANSSGTVREHPTWEAVAHLFNHQTHHRGQVTTLLSQAGVDPGPTDMLAVFGDYRPGA